jgi:hypothetical protein
VSLPIAERHRRVIADSLTDVVSRILGFSVVHGHQNRGRKVRTRTIEDRCLLSFALSLPVKFVAIWTANRYNVDPLDRTSLVRNWRSETPRRSDQAVAAWTRLPGSRTVPRSYYAFSLFFSSTVRIFGRCLAANASLFERR